MFSLFTFSSNIGQGLKGPSKKLKEQNQGSYSSVLSS